MRVGPAANVARINVVESITALWTFAHANGISLDDIIERTLNAGVTIDGLLVKDAGIPQAAVIAHEAALTIGAGSIAAVNEAVVTAHEAALSIAGSQIPSLPEALVTAHQAALVIALSQLSDGGNLTEDDVAEAITALWEFAHASGLKTDVIVERTATAGVTVDGVVLKDKGIMSQDFAAATDPFIRILLTGDGFNRFILAADGKSEWGPGNLTQDTNLYRDAAGVLKTDGALHVAGVLNPLSDLVVADRTITLSIGANDDLASGTVPVQRLSVAGGAADISGFAGGAAGRLLIVYSIVTLNITLQHQNGGSTAANRIICPGFTNLVLGSGDSAMLRYDDTFSRWVVISSGV